jgi:hypothetical protein
MHWRFALVVVSIASGACSSTYHPEYHPVVYTSQQVSYPPVVVGASDGSQRPVVVVTPPPASAPAVPPPPPGFFAPE